MFGLFNSPRPASLTEAELLDALAEWDEDEPIPLDHGLVPAPIRTAVEAQWVPGSALHRLPTSSAIEWWLFGPDGTLIEVFWLED